VNTPVVREGRVITANGPTASKAFADEIVHALTAVEW
jgi:putative intracellular protease/amidase